MTGLSDEDIREAAAEAGISPAELREALSEQNTALAKPSAGQAVGIPASQRGSVVLNARANLPQAPEDAVRSVRASIEAQVGERGHMQGAAEAGVYDETRGVIYRVRAEEDGRGGALVHVDIDAAPSKGKRVLLGVAFGAGLTMLGLAGLLFGSWTVLALTAGLGVLGGGAFTASGRSKKAIYNQAHAIASHALIEAEERTAGDPRALPPG